MTELFSVMKTEQNENIRTTLIRLDGMTETCESTLKLLCKSETLCEFGESVTKSELSNLQIIHFKISRLKLNQSSNRSLLDTWVCCVCVTSPRRHF